MIFKKNKPFYVPRDESQYLVSRILNYNFEFINNVEQHQLILEKQTNLFQQLNFSQFEWNLAEDEFFGSEQIRELGAILEHLENDWVFQMADEDDLHQLTVLKRNTVFGSIEQIQAEAQQLLGVYFPLSLLFRYDNNDIGDLVKQDILDLYNFVVKSKIMTKNEVLQLLYPIKFYSLNPWVGPAALTSAAYGINRYTRSAMIGMDVSYNWYDEDFIKNNFDDGRLSTRDYAHAFVHEFAHALCYFYNLGPDLKNSLNVNITDLNYDQSIGEKIIHHFDTNFSEGWGWTSTRYLVQNALNFIREETLTENLKNNINANLFAKWIVCPSNYGRTILIDPADTENVLHPDGEWFAEAFAYYFLTPPEECQAIWGVWHDFFTTQMNLRQKRVESD